MAHTHFHTNRLFKQLVLFGVIEDTVCTYLHLGFSFICELMEIKSFVGSFLGLSPTSEAMTEVSQWNPVHPKGPKGFDFTV